VALAVLVGAGMADAQISDNVVKLGVLNDHDQVWRPETEVSAFRKQRGW
jgi:hypothetical protein